MQSSYPFLGCSSSLAQILISRREQGSRGVPSPLTRPLTLPSLPDHVRRFDALQCLPRTFERNRIFFASQTHFFYSPMMLLDHLIYVPALAQLDAMRLSAPAAVFVSFSANAWLYD